jgi:hypothetical protein
MPGRPQAVARSGFTSGRGLGPGCHRSGGRTANRGLQITVRLRAMRSNRWPPCRADWAPVQHLDRATSGCNRCVGRTRVAGPHTSLPCVDNRIHQAAQTVLPGLGRLLLDRHPQARSVVAAGRLALTAVMTLSGWSPGQVARGSDRVLTETFRITGGQSILHRVPREEGSSGTESDWLVQLARALRAVVSVSWVSATLARGWR